MSDRNHLTSHRSELSRRGVLRAGTAALAVTGLAGCSALPGGLGGGFNYGQYLIAPSELDRDDYYFTYAQPSKIAKNEDNFDEDIYEGNTENSYGVEQQFGILNDLDVDFDDVDNIVNYATDSVSVFTVKSDTTEDIIDELDELDLDVEDEIGGYDIYGDDSTQSTRIGIQNNKIITISDTQDASDTLEAVIDAENGEEDRYANEYDSFDVLLDKLGTGARVGGRGMEESSDYFPDNVVAVGNQLSLNGETSEDKVVYVHEEAEDVDTEDIREFVEDEGFFEEANEFSVSKNGRAAIATAAFDTDELEFIV